MVLRGEIRRRSNISDSKLFICFLDICVVSVFGVFSNIEFRNNFF